MTQAIYVVSLIDNQRYCKTNGQFSRHLKSHNLTYRQYYEKYITGVNEMCPFCNEPKKFYQKSNSYAQTCCSNDCISKVLVKKHQNTSAEAKKQTSLKKSSAWSKKSTDELTDISNKRKSTLMEKYGVPHVSSINGVVEKTKATNRLRYGTDYPLQSAQIRTLAKFKVKEKYGATCTMDIPGVREKVSASARIGYYKNKHDDLNRELLLSIYTNSGIMGICKHFGIVKSTAYSLLKEHDVNLIPCDFSLFESNVIEFVKSIYSGKCIYNSRKIIGGKELDIYFPELNFAIECNGAYWHSESRGRGKLYHKNKLQDCKAHGIDLLNIWDYHWYNNTDIVKSMIRHRLGLSERIYARKTRTVLVDEDTEKQFLTANSLTGYVKSHVCIGLEHNNELVQLASFSKTDDITPIFKSVSMCTKLNTAVVGGCGKLISYFVRTNALPLHFFVNSEHFSGNVFRALGLLKFGETDPLCKYTDDYLTFLSSIDDAEIVLYDRIWDCGNQIWEFKI